MGCEIPYTRCEMPGKPFCALGELIALRTFCGKCGAKGAAPGASGTASRNMARQPSCVPTKPPKVRLFMDALAKALR